MQENTIGSVVFQMAVKYVFLNDAIDGLVQDFSISFANAMEILQSCTKPSLCPYMRGCGRLSVL